MNHHEHQKRVTDHPRNTNQDDIVIKKIIKKKFLRLESPRKYLLEYIATMMLINRIRLVDIAASWSKLKRFEIIILFFIGEC
jgi:hypothetical protein